MDKEKFLSLCGKYGNISKNVTFAFLNTVNSTNDYVKKAFQGDKMVVFSRGQSAGRGRLGRSFFSGEGGLYMSAALRPEGGAQSSLRFPAAAAVAVTDAIFEICRFMPCIKWPNDLLVDGKKICGILVESVHGGDGSFSVIGIGINLRGVLPPELPGAGSIEGLTGLLPEPERLAALILRELFTALESEPEGLIRRYASRCSTLGRELRVSSPGGELRGLAVGIDRQGALLVRRADGSVIPVTYGEATLSPR